MITIQGNGVSAGIVKGTLFFYQHTVKEKKQEQSKDSDLEWLRFQKAQSLTIKRLKKLEEKVQKEAAALFLAYQMLATDFRYVESIRTMIMEENQSAETAVRKTAKLFSEKFASIDDAYIQARAIDIKDVSEQILNVLCGTEPEMLRFESPILLAAEELTPSELILLDKTKILGLLLVKGSAFDHTVILARSMGIPVIVGLEADLKPEYQGCEALIDGSAGIVILDPDKKVCKEFIKRQEEQLKRQKRFIALKGQDDVTKDGKKIRICCNINTPEEVEAVLENDGGGIGLFRSEYLYLNRFDYPTEEEQFKAYQKVLAAMNRKRVIIRTCDIGADKKADYLKLPKEENPAMGFRSLRISLTRPLFFRTQLRALYRASVYGRLGIMFPMVTSVWEVREAKRMCEEVKQELQMEGILYDNRVEIGIMIETPAAAIISNELAKEADFFCCGTNDLTQYTLACDRQNKEIERFYDSHHPAVLHLLKMAAEAAHANGIWIGICGELASDFSLTETFLEIGIDELSVSPQKVLPLRNMIRNIDTREMR